MSETRTEAAPFSVAEVEAALRRTWKWLLVAGAIAIVAGTLAIVVPLAGGIALATLLGILFLFHAGALLGDGFALRRQTRRMLLRLLLAVLYAAAGVVLLAAPLTGLVTLTFVLGVLFLVEGSMRVAVAITDRRVPARGWQAGSGVLTVLLGALVLATWPSSSQWAIGLLAGINLLFWGWQMVALALAGRRATALRGAPEPRPV